jgi:hypothetical protein
MGGNAVTVYGCSRLRANLPGSSGQVREEEAASVCG